MKQLPYNVPTIGRTKIRMGEIVFGVRGGTHRYYDEEVVLGVYHTVKWVMWDQLKIKS